MSLFTGGMSIWFVSVEGGDEKMSLDKKEVIKEKSAATSQKQDPYTRSIVTKKYINKLKLT